MVVRLIGKVEGQDVIFTRLKGDIWTAEVPAQKSGRYVMELTAFDEAGNIAYCTDVLFSYDATAMKFTIEPLPYQCTYINDDYEIGFVTSEYDIEKENDNYFSELSESSFCIELLRRGDACEHYVPRRSPSSASASIPPTSPSSGGACRTPSPAPASTC